MERLIFAMVLMLAPHTKLPAIDWAYLIRPTDLLLILAAALYLRANAAERRISIAINEMLLVFVVSVLSVLWGSYRFNILDQVALFQSGNPIYYLWFPIKKIILIAICFLGFQFVVRSFALTNELIMKFWHRGLLLAVLLHALTYVVSEDYLAYRGGIFMEGNQAGSYYLLSFFLMWHARLSGSKYAAEGMLLAITGIALSQSTASLVLLTPLAFLTYLTLPNESKKAVFGPIQLVFFGAVLILGVYFVFGDEIVNKLTNRDINPSSFSRYDRIASVKSAFNIFLANPIFGVGIQGYAFALKEYADPFIILFFDWDYRRIANNVYAEILAEQGIIGFVAMTALLCRIVWLLIGQLRAGAVLIFAALSIFLSWMAFPTYTASYHWIGLAILVRSAIQLKGGREE